MIERNTIITGDCLEHMACLPDNSISMIFTDPPYGHNNNSDDLIARREAALGTGTPTATRPITNDGPEANDLFRAFLVEARRVLNRGGCCCCCGGGGGPDPQCARWSLWMDEILTFKQMVIWDKGRMGMGWQYRRSYETVLVAHKGTSCNWYDTSSTVENIIRPHDYGIRKIIPDATQHPTCKPIQLAMHFIRLHSRPGDLILDPFCGSGSTLEAAFRERRDYIGIEIDPAWAERARKRLEECKERSEMFEPEEVNTLASKVHKEEESLW